MAEPAETSEDFGSLPTARLIVGAKAGDQAAVEALYERYHQRAFAIVRVRMGKLLRSKMESEDLVQSLLLESFKDLGQFEYRTEGAFLHWLSTIAEHKIRNKVEYLTAQKRDARLETIPANESDSNSGFEPRHAVTPSKIVSQAEEALRLEVLIQQLPQEQAELIVMAKLEGLTYEEMASITGKSPEAVRKATARALAKIASEMAK